MIVFDVFLQSLCTVCWPGHITELKSQFSSLLDQLKAAEQSLDHYREEFQVNFIINSIVLCCIVFDGVFIAAQCTATFSKIYCAPPNLGITRT
jgi:hypothetical protein